MKSTICFFIIFERHREKYQVTTVYYLVTNAISINLINQNNIVIKV